MYDLDRLKATLATAKEGDLVVVARINKQGAAIHVLNPDASRLTNLASSLLDHAGDMLEGSDAAGDVILHDQIRDALALLPDRFAEDDGEE